VSAGHPVYLTRVDGHAGWANSKALAVAGIDAKTPDPPGGRIIRDAAGAPAGVLVDRAQALVTSKIPEPPRAVRKRRLAAGLQACARAGLTEVHDAGVGLDAVGIYKELLREKGLPVRVYVMLRGPGEFLAKGAILKPEVGLGDGLLTIRAIKVVADGALGSRGALLLAPYADEPGTKGLLTVDEADFRRLLPRAIAQGFQVNTHAIGDGANRFVLDAYERAFGGYDGSRYRFRIEHAQVLAPSDVPRFKSLGVIPSMQPTHCTSDMYWAEDRLGAERAKGAYLWQTFLSQGVPVAGGSDAPVEDIAVLPGLYAAVTRQDAKGWPPGGWHPAERVTIEEALRMFATGAAFAVAYRGSKEVVACQMGDGTTNTGAFHESLNLAKIYHLPIVYFVVNNLYGMGLRVEQGSAVSELYRKACAYDMQSWRVDGNDVLAVRDAMRNAAAIAREQHEPSLIEAVSYRFRGHSVVDPDRYRDKEEVQQGREHDPIAAFAARLMAAGLLDEQQASQIDEQAQQEVEEAVKFAEESPFPSVEEFMHGLEEYVYAPGEAAGKGD